MRVDSLDRQIILNWVDDQGIEKWLTSGYAFQGYNVYQFNGPSADKTTGVRVATYDLVDAVTTIFDDVYDVATGYVIKKPVQFGTDSGIKRTFQTTTDVVNSQPLANGTPYYFGVTSYSFNPVGKPSQLESSPNLITVIPHSLTPGYAVHASYNQTVPITHSAGVSTATASVNVASPTTLIPSDYEINIVVQDSVFSSDLGYNVANPRWQLLDKTNNKVVLGPILDYGTVNDQRIANGLKVSLAGAPFYTYGKELGANLWTGPTAYNFKRVNVGSGDATTVSGDAGIYAGNDFGFGGLLDPNQVTQTVAIEFCAKGQGQNAYDYFRTAASGGAPYGGFFPQPFKVWQLNPDGTHMRQLDFMFMEQTTSTYFDSVFAPGAASGDREYWFVIGETYTATAKAKYTGSTLASASAADSIVWGGWMTKSDLTKPPYVAGDVWTLQATNIVTDHDKWTFSTKAIAATYSAAAAKADVARVNVFPNPYIGFNPLEKNKYERFVTFTHLPAKATIRVFNLAGVLVRTLQKNSNDQFYQWDLKNESGFPVAAGMYIVYVDMPDLGATKTLKLGVIPEQQYIDRW